jgi:Carboxypeptidase regulatory-like domain
MVWKIARWACMLAILASCGLPGQSKRSNEDTNTRSVSGVVTDASGNQVAKAVVQLKDTKTLQIRSFITETDGAYHFAGLSANVDYELKAEHDGHASSSKRLSVFDSKRAATINLKLKGK